jgi:UDP-N-acetyl-D-galactosamine dehydrogenase
MTIQTTQLEKIARGQQAKYAQASTNPVLAKLLRHEAKMAVVGLGYVGLPIALEFAKSMPVIGFDIKPERVALMRKGIDPSGELRAADFAGKYMEYVSEVEPLKDAQFYIVAVPTPVDHTKKPNLHALKAATYSVATVLKRGDYVVFESTVYPGCTEEVCLPILEEVSGLTLNKDFKIGYSPERINPGDKNNTLTSIKKIVSGSDEEATAAIAAVYSHVIKAGIFPATSIKVAEAAKVVENTQRDVNIGLMNELSNIFKAMGINTLEVLEAAGSKWNFLPFYPGLVGGHCIGVDPYYLAYKAEQLGIKPGIILNTRATNDSMPIELANRVFEALAQKGIQPEGARILVRGITFKENVQDIRNSKTAEMVQYMLSQKANVAVEDPLAIPGEVLDTYGVFMIDQPKGTYDAIVLAVPHDEFREDDINFYSKHGGSKPVVFDVRGILQKVPESMVYHTL